MPLIARLLFLLLLAALLPPASAKTPVEAGQVKWQRDLDAALKTSRTTRRPVFLLFQEIPGCATCQKFGQGPLSHPLLVEAMEDAFIPVLVHNNRPGTDRKILERFREPAWNNPVVRFLNAQGEDILSRKAGVWSTRGIATRMIEALKQSGRPVPPYLQWVVDETAEQTDTAVFQMDCYYVGETGLGAIDGVLRTRAGWIGAQEVVEVEYDSSKLTYLQLGSQAFSRKCANFAFATSKQQRKDGTALGGRVRAMGWKQVRDAEDSEKKKFLTYEPIYTKLNLSPLQAVKVNAALGNRTDPARWLSPRQRAMLAQLKKPE